MHKFLEFQELFSRQYPAKCFAATYSKILGPTSKNLMTADDLKWIFARDCEGTGQL